MYMLEKLYKKGYLNYEKLILENAKALGLNAEEGFLLIHILKNYLITNTLAISDIAKQVLLTPAKLDKLIASLMERGYYEVYLSYDNGKGPRGHLGGDVLPDPAGGDGGHHEVLQQQRELRFVREGEEKRYDCRKQEARRGLLCHHRGGGFDHHRHDFPHVLDGGHLGEVRRRGPAHHPHPVPP